MNRPTNLLADFEDLSTAEWIKSIEKYLKGRAYETLYHEVEPGVKLAPFYRKTETEGLALPVLHNNEWKVAEAFELQSPKTTNAAILKALEAGVELILLKIEDGQPAMLEELLNGVFLEMVELRLSGAAVVKAPLAWAIALAKLPNAASSSGILELPASSPEQAAQLLLDIQELLPNWLSIAIKLERGNEATLSQSLAKIIKAGEAQLWALLELGVPKVSAAQAIFFELEVTDDYFQSIAMLRSLHKLWATVLNAYDHEGLAQLLLRTQMSGASEDPYWNMIAATTQALSAAIAEPYALEIYPPQTKDIAFGRRIARNIQHLLKMESHINKIIDPAAGSYYIENYTMQLTKKAWNQFIHE